MNSGAPELATELSAPVVRLREIPQCEERPQTSVRLVSVDTASGDCFLVDDTGQVRVLNGNHVDPVVDFKRPIKASYANGCFIVASENGFGFRSLLTANPALIEMALNSDKSKIMSLELTKDQAVALAALATVDELPKRLSAFAKKVDILVKKGEQPTYLVEVKAVKDLAKELELTLSTRKKKRNFFPQGYLILEKMRFFLDPTCPYSEEECPSYAPEQDVASATSLTAEAARRLTFDKWPKKECLFAQPHNLAAAGFFLRPAAANLDRVACFSCDVCLVNWEPQDDPMQEHIQHGPKCDFVKGADQRNITFEETRSSLFLLPWSFIREQSNVHIQAADITLGEMSVKCSWAAAAVPPLPGLHKPSIFLFDLNKVVQKPIEIYLDLYASCLAKPMELDEEPKESIKRNGAFDWLNSVDDVSSRSSTTISNQPLCQVTSLCTTTALDPVLDTLTHNSKVVAMLCTAITVDDARLKKSMETTAPMEEVSTLNTMNSFCANSTRIDEIKPDTTQVQRRPFILVHHVVEFPRDANLDPLAFASAAARLNSTEPMEVSETEKSTQCTPTVNLEPRLKDPELVPLYYSNVESVAVGMQCVRLHSGFDSTNYKITYLSFSENGSKLLAVLNASETATGAADPVCGILVYSRLPDLHMLNLKPVVNLNFGKPVKRAVFLDQDYFGSATAKRTAPISTEPLNETVLVHFEDGTLQLVDLDFGKSNTLDVEHVVDLTLNPAGDIMVLTESGRFFHLEFQNAIPHCQGDPIEELVIDLSVDSTHKLGYSTMEDMLKLFDESKNQKVCRSEVEKALNSTNVFTVSNLNQLQELWRLIQAKPLTPVNSALPRCSSRLATDAGALHLHTTAGVNINTPSELVEYNPTKNRTGSLHPAYLTASTCQEYCGLNKLPYNELYFHNGDGTRVWQVRSQRDLAKRTFVVEMAVSFGLDLSHINMNLGFAGFTRGVPDINVTIYMAKSPNDSLGEDMVGVLGLCTESNVPGPSTGLSTEHYLDLLNKSVDVLEQNYDVVLGPYRAADLLDGLGKQSVLQIPAVLLYRAVSAGRDADPQQRRSWLTELHRFYVVIDVNEKQTDAQTQLADFNTKAAQSTGRDSIYQAGAKRARSMDTASGGVVPLPSSRTFGKKMSSKLKMTGRKRTSQAPALIADAVAMSALNIFATTTSFPKLIEYPCSLEYIAIAVFKHSHSAPKINSERCLMISAGELHQQLVHLVGGTSPLHTSEPYYKTLTSQMQAADLLQWIFSHWHLRPMQSCADSIAKELMENTSAFLYNCYVIAPRTLAHKVTNVLNDLFQLHYVNQSAIFTKLCEKLANEVVQVLKDNGKFKHSGSLHYFTVMTYSLCKHILCTVGSDQTADCVQRIQQVCANIVLQVAKVWRSRRAHQSSLSGGRNQLTDEIELYDAPPQVAVWTLDPSRMNAAVPAGRYTYHSGHFPSDSERNEIKRRDGSGFRTSFELCDVAAKVLDKSSPFNADRKTKGLINTPLANMYIYDEFSDTEMKWYEHLGMPSLQPLSYPTKDAISDLSTRQISATGAARKAGLYNGTAAEEAYRAAAAVSAAASNSSATFGQPDADQSSLADLLTSNESYVSIFEKIQKACGEDRTRRFLLSNAYLPGLLETEQICYRIASSSHQIRALNLNSKTDTKLTAVPQVADHNDDSLLEPEVAQLTKGIEAREEFERKRAFMPSQSKNLGPLPRNERLSSKADEMYKSMAEMYVLDCHNRFAQTSHPVSSKSLDPANALLEFSELYDDLGADVDADDLIDLEQEVDSPVPTRTLPIADNAKNSGVVFKHPPLYLLELDGSQSTQVIQLVLDFQVPTLLTDFVIPANDLFSAVAVDGWLHDDKPDPVRFAYSVEIERRSLALSDLSPNELVRYVRISFVVRETRRSKVSFMAGRFYGLRSFSPWQAYKLDADETNLHDVLKMHSVKLHDVEKAAARLRRKYYTVAPKLRNIFKQYGREAHKLYRICSTDRAMYNCFQRILQRSRLDMQQSSTLLKADSNSQVLPTAEVMDWHGCRASAIEPGLLVESESWWSAPLDELRSVSTQFMALANDLQFLTQNLRKDSVQSVLSSALDLDGAVSLFGCLTVDNDSYLQAQSCAFLFHQGSRSNWWPAFFPAVLRRFFINGSSDPVDDIFVRLAYLCDQSVRHHELRVPIVQRLLLHVNEQIASKVADITQLSWCLLLLSATFDVIVPNAKHQDRWSFLAGQPCTNFAQVSQIDSSLKRYTRKVGSVKDSNYWNPQASVPYQVYPLSSGTVFYGNGFDDKYVTQGRMTQLEQTVSLELKKLAQDIKHIGKDLDLKLTNNQISADTYHQLKKEQKVLNQHYNTAQSYLAKGMATMNDSFLDKIIIGGLEKSMNITADVNKAPLASQEDIHIDETDTAAKNELAQHTKELRQRLVRMRKSLQVLLKQIKSSIQSRSKIHSSGFGRSRRFAVRMRLPREMVITTIQSLTQLFCQSSTLLSPATQLLLFKVCAKLSVHGCPLPISFCQAMSSVEQTTEVLATDVVEAENPVPTVPSLSPDQLPGTSTVRTPHLSDSDEEETTPEGAAKRHKSDPADEKMLLDEDSSSFSSAASTSLDTSSAKRTTPSNTLVTSGLLDVQTGAVEDRDLHLAILMERPAMNTAGTPEFPFSFAAYDNPVQSDVDFLIVLAAIALKPLEIKTPYYWDNYRTWFLRQIAFSVARAHYDRGEPLSDIFRWFDYVSGAEMDAARSLSSETSYIKWGLSSILHARDFIEREFNLSANKNIIPDPRAPSHAALACATFYSDFYNVCMNAAGATHAMDTDDDLQLFHLDEGFDAVFDEVVALARGTSAFGAVADDLLEIVQRKNHVKNKTVSSPEPDNDINRFFDDAESTYLPIDSSDDVVQYVAVKTTVPLSTIVDRFSKLRFIQSMINIRRCIRGLSPSNAPDVEELRKPSPTQGTEYARPVRSHTSKKLDKTKKTCEARIRDQLLATYQNKVEVMYLHVRSAPLQLCPDQLCNSSLQVLSANRLRRLESERRVNFALALNRMAPLLTRMVKTSTVYDSTAPPSSGGTCSGWLCESISALLAELQVRKSNGYPGRTHRSGSGDFLRYLLAFYSDLYGNIMAQKSASADTALLQATFILSEQAIASLIQFAVDFEYMNEHTWLYLFRVLAAVDAPPEGKPSQSSDAKNYKFTHWIENSPNFKALLKKFLVGSLGKLSMVSNTQASVGPAVCTVFRRFVGIVLVKQASQTAMDAVFSVLTEVLAESRTCGYLTLPIDAVVELTNALDSMDRVCPCTPAVFGRFLAALMDYVADFFHETQRIQRHLPGAEQPLKLFRGLPASIVSAALESTPLPSNMCFTMLLTPASQRERNSLLNEKLRTAGQQGSQTTKTSKNITFVKRADILENTVRDGEVSVADQFAQAAYSMMRLSVRYVSQYRPHILKTLLNVEPKAVKRAIDTLFMFVSCTKNADDISKESFKVVTLADAVVHLLLIVSETSMEDPDCCRLFIRTVIQTLRDRVTRDSIPRPGTSTDPPLSNMFLMDLPVPVLALLRSLIRGVSRCQIFVDEGGHTFVAEQLQLALDARSEDWPQRDRFNTLSRQLTALTSHFTGVESDNPMLNVHPPASVDDKILNPVITSQQNRPPTGFGSSNAVAEQVHDPVNYCLTYPTVHVLPSNSCPGSYISSNYPSGVRMSVTVKAAPTTNTQSLPTNVFNFTPICTVRSETISPAMLSALTGGAEKRGRLHHFQHKFQPKKQWMDVVFILPYKVVLFEVAIRLPENMPQFVPTAVQVEVSSDPAQASWHVLSCPVVPSPVPHIRISTQAYKFPVTAVRINFKAPLLSQILSLSQILLLGTTSVQAIRSLHDSQMFESELMNNWLSLFCRLCARIDVPVWLCAPRLSEALIRVYMADEHLPDVIRQVHDLLHRLDSKNKPNQTSVIMSLVHYLVSGGRICPKTYLSVAELLYTSCAFPSPHVTGKQPSQHEQNRPIHVVHNLTVVRQRQLLQGIQQLLSEVIFRRMGEEQTEWIRPEVLREVSVFFWAASCSLWHNVSEESTRYDAVAVCLEFGPNLIPQLIKLIHEAHEPNIFQASCWLICTLARASSSLLNQIFDKFGLGRVPSQQFSKRTLEAVGLICQSKVAVHRLISANLIAEWTQQVSEICTTANHQKLPQLGALIECISQLCSIDSVIQFMDNNEGAAMFRQLIDYLIRFCPTSARQTDVSGSGQSHRLVESSVALLRKCLAYGGGHRERIALIMADFINQATAANVKGVALPETLEALVLKLVIADETIPVRLTGVVAKHPYTRQTLEKRMMHPLFGCNQDDRIMDVSVYTLCQDLLPVNKAKVQKAGKGSSVESDLLLGTQLKLTDEYDEKEQVDKKESPPKSGPAENTAADYPFTYKQFAVQLSCAAYSTKHALNHRWCLAKVLDGLRALKRFNRRQADGVSLLERCLRAEDADSVSENAMDVDEQQPSSHTTASPRPSTPRSRTTSVNAANEPPDADLTDGYFMLNLRVRTSLQHNILNSVEEEPLLAEFLTDIPTSHSTLLRFAKCGGIKALGNAVDVVSRVDAKLKAVSQKLAKVTNPEFNYAKERLSAVRKVLSRYGHEPNAECNFSGFCGLIDALQRPMFFVIHLSRLLNSVEVTVKDTDAATKSTKTVHPMSAAIPGAALKILPSPYQFDDAFEELGNDEDEVYYSVADIIDFGPPKPAGPNGSVGAKIVASVPIISSSTYDVDEFEQMASDLIAGPSFGPAGTTIPVDYEFNAFGFGPDEPNYTSKDDFKSTHKNKALNPAKNMENVDMIVVALSVFLEIDAYGPVLVEFDKVAAKKLIYIMLGISPPTFSNKVVDGLVPAVPQAILGQSDAMTPVAETTHRDRIQLLANKITDSLLQGPGGPYHSIAEPLPTVDHLSLVPFFALSRCFESTFPPQCSLVDAELVRQQAVENGTIDVLLTLLSHFSHQPAHQKPLREQGDLPVTQLLEQLISFNIEVQAALQLLTQTQAGPAKVVTNTGPFASSAVSLVGTSASQFLQQFESAASSALSSFKPFQAMPISPVVLGQTATAATPTGTALQTTKPTSQEANYWAKGTGFGSGTTHTKWNLNQHVARQRQHEVTVTCLLNVLTNVIRPMGISCTERLQVFLNTSTMPDDPDDLNSRPSSEPRFDDTENSVEVDELKAFSDEFCQVLERSCLPTTLASYMVNDSVLDISCHAVVYEAVVGLLLVLCRSPAIKSVDGLTTYQLADQLLVSKTAQANGIYQGLKRICQVVDIYMGRLHKSQPTALAASNSSVTSDKSPTAEEEETLAEFLKAAKQALEAMEERLKDSEVHQTQGSVVEVDANAPEKHPFASLEAVYLAQLKDLQFQTIPFFKTDGVSMLFGYQYQTNLTSSTAHNGKRTRRLAQEIVSLSSSLPLSFSSSVFVRAADERLDVMKVLITGPEDTPYSCGCFEFDVYFPPEYPQSPMMMNLQTTGNRSVRFNPNLYEEGKVCLSILNTWSGRPEERWSSETSSFLQVLVSIQSLILVNEPYFNEPGFERSRGTPSGDQSSREYSANIRHQCIRWAMVEMLRNPPKAFEDVVRRHFWIKRDTICEQVQEWIAETRTMIEKNQSVRVLPQHLTLIEKNYDSLLSELAKLKCPDPDLEYLTSKYVTEYQHKSC